MKKNYLLIVLLMSFLSLNSAFATQHTVTTSGFTFTPDSLDAHVGDTIVYVLSGIHSAVEVSQATWLANGNTPSGTFGVPFGGGMSVVDQVKTYYYVCGNHYFMGMKGRIFVTNPSGINTVSSTSFSFDVFPNPTAAGANVKTNLPAGKENQLKIFDIMGSCVFQQDNIFQDQYLDLSGIQSGIYFVSVMSGDLKLERKLVVSR